MELLDRYNSLTCRLRSNSNFESIAEQRISASKVLASRRARQAREILKAELVDEFDRRVVRGYHIGRHERRSSKLLTELLLKLGGREQLADFLGLVPTSISKKVRLTGEDITAAELAFPDLPVPDAIDLLSHGLAKAVSLANYLLTGRRDDLAADDLPFLLSLLDDDAWGDAHLEKNLDEAERITRKLVQRSGGLTGRRIDPVNLIASSALVTKWITPIGLSLRAIPETLTGVN